MWTVYAKGGHAELPTYLSCAAEQAVALAREVALPGPTALCAMSTTPHSRLDAGEGLAQAGHGVLLAQLHLKQRLGQVEFAGCGGLSSGSKPAKSRRV